MVFLMCCSDPITPPLKNLQGFPIAYYIKYIFQLLAFKTSHNLALIYLSSIRTHYFASPILFFCQNGIFSFLYLVLLIFLALLLSFGPSWNGFSSPTLFSGISIFEVFLKLNLIITSPVKLSYSTYSRLLLCTYAPLLYKLSVYIIPAPPHEIPS